MENYTYELVLEHSGVKGMKWGIRRYQNKDGSLTPAGKKRYNKEMADIRAEKKKIKNTAETEAKLKRLASEKKSLEDLKTATKKKSQIADDTPEKKTVKDLSDTELRSKITRLELEKRYSDLNPKKVSFGERLLKESIMPAVIQSGRQLLTDTLIKKGKDMLGLNDKNSDDGVAALRKKVEKLNLEKQYRDLTSPSSSKKSRTLADIKDIMSEVSDQELNDILRRSMTERQIEKLLKGE